MALIAMACYDLKDSGRTEMTGETLRSLMRRIDFNRHRLFVIDNNSCEETKELLDDYKERIPFTLITNEENVGTAKAINMAWRQRTPGENVVKMDNDVVVHYDNWVDDMEYAIEKMPSIGIVGLKRRDLLENPNSEGWMRSQLIMVPHEKGERWMVVEKCQHIMGTCQMYSSALIDAIGGLYQMGGLYGYDDSLASARAQVAGFATVFLPHINIDHIDTGGTEYTQWKINYATDMQAAYTNARKRYVDGELPIYHEL